MKRNMARSIDRIAKFVRQEKTVDVVKFCKFLNLSPSSFYNYRKFVVDMYEDIIYEDGMFKALEVKDYSSPQQNLSTVESEPDKSKV